MEEWQAKSEHSLEMRQLETEFGPSASGTEKMTPFGTATCWPFPNESSGLGLPEA